MKRNEKENNKNIYLWIVIILLIIIILILLFCNKIGKIDNCCLVPTGNVDIFDIDFNCNCEGKDKCKGSYPIWNEDKSKNELNKVYVDDKDGNYIYHRELNIFSNPFYEFTSKIAPGVHNSYSFIVHNDSNINVKYNLEMYKECNYNVNLKYRLKRNGSYIIGNEDKWVNVEELKTTIELLKSNNNDNYVLDWKWEYNGGNDKLDTYIGENMKDTYKLFIQFYFEQV